MTQSNIKKIIYFFKIYFLKIYFSYKLLVKKNIFQETENQPCIIIKDLIIRKAYRPQHAS